MIFIKQIIRDYLTLLGLLWLLIEVFSYFYPAHAEILKNPKMFWIAIISIFIISFFKNIPRRKVTIKIPGVDSKISLFPKGKYPAVYGVTYSSIVFKIPRCLRRGSSLRQDIPRKNVDVAFSSSNYFNTDTEIISSESLLGQYIKYHNLQSAKIDLEISNSLSGISYDITSPKKGNKISYPMGTVANFQNTNNYVFLLAITEIVDNGTNFSASSNYQFVQTAFANLWTDVRNKLDNRVLNLPLIGSGIGKSYQKSIESILFICLSYINESKIKRINSGINIYLRKESFTKGEFEQLKSLLNLITI